MRPIREVPDTDYMVWGSELNPYEIKKGQLIIGKNLISNWSIDHFGRRQLEKHGWRYGQSLHGQKDKTHEGLKNPIHIKGMSHGGSFPVWMNTTQDSTYECVMGYWQPNDQHYPSKDGLTKRPGLASDPEDYFDKRLTFDITTRSDQSRRHQPAPGRIVMSNGTSYYPEELKNLPCLNNPTCKSRRNHSLQSRQKDLCEVCMRKQRYCQSGSARTRRTERRRQARLDEQSSSSSQMTPNELELPDARSNTGVGRIIKATKRATWRRPCVENATVVLLGDSQVFQICLYLYDLRYNYR